MLAFSIQWAALRPLQVRQDDPSLDAEQESFLVQKRALLGAFVDRSLSAVTADLGKINAEARAAREAICEKQFPGRRPDRNAVRNRLVELSLGRFCIRIVLAWTPTS